MAVQVPAGCAVGLTVVLVRHTAVAVPQGHCYGRLDVGLGPLAGLEIAGVVARVAEIRADGVLSSPARRSRVLAEAIAAAAGCAVRVDARLAELDFGTWEGLAWDEVPREALDRWAADLAGFAPPGGESGGALIARVEAAWRALPKRGVQVVVSHGGPLRVLGALLRGEAVDLARPAPALGSVEVFRDRQAGCASVGRDLRR